MIFTPTVIEGMFVIEPERREDERGFFARTYCEREFREHGLEFRPVQCSVSFNRKKGTLRGLHFQAAPREEAKLVSCARGSVWDVVVDLRRDSPSWLRHSITELSAQNRRMAYAPPGTAHGFLTMEDESEVLYSISEYFHPELARGVRWDDPALGIVWPGDVVVISERDASFPVLAACGICIGKEGW